AFLFTGVPLVAWGLFDARTYFASPFRTVYTVLMLLATLLVVIFVPKEGRGEGLGVRTLPRQRWAILYLQLASLLFVILSPLADRHGWLVYSGGPLVRGTGLVLTCTGYFFMSWAVFALGRQFSMNVTIQKNHELITNGPYRFIRHPRYLGILLFFAGISLVFRSGVSMALVVVTLFVIRWRIKDEEKLMRGEFKAYWDAYVKQTWQLVPFLF
ncbi:MAG: isoprenylcysteine carboxylmethyltransferase family protein, partial [Fibrobacterota bacterium]